MDPIYLDKIRTLVCDDLQKMDQKIESFVASYVDLIPEICLHTIKSGGKRLRPILTLATSKLLNYQGNLHIDLAIIVEFIHTATLLHDDVVDKSSLRRGSKTANEIWGNKESVLVGDFLLGRAFFLMGNASSLEIYKILSASSMIISEGEVRQLVLSGSLNLKKEDYIEIIGAKTAQLFAASCEISAVLDKQEAKICKSLKDYGYYLGIAFQIIDDVLDYVSDQDKLGKNIGDDFKEGKVTLPLIIAFNKADIKEKKFWQDIFAKQDFSEANLKLAFEFINKYDAIKLAVNLAKKYAFKAKDSLAVFKDKQNINQQALEALILLLDFVIERNF